MKPKIFLDTNILLDLIQERPGFDFAARILQQQEDGHIQVCISILSMANIAYVLRKIIPYPLIVPTLKQIASIVEVMPMDNDQLQRAFLLDGPDFEDLMQFACAVANGCSTIITHNPRDFRIKKGLSDHFTIPVIITPEDFLRT